MNVPPPEQGNIFSIANAGLAFGALSFGLAVDVIGRKWAFNLTCLITSVFGLLLVQAPELGIRGPLLTADRPLQSSTTVRYAPSTF